MEELERIGKNAEILYCLDCGRQINQSQLLRHTTSREYCRTCASKHGDRWILDEETGVCTLIDDDNNVVRTEKITLEETAFDIQLLKLEHNHD